ncbi:MAG: hypothetical protein ABJZ55_06050 [Fuerstiella sp.]
MAHRDAQAFEALSKLNTSTELAQPINQNAVLFVVPNNRQKVVSQSEQNIAEFRTHLHNTMQLAEELVADSGSHEHLQVEHQNRLVQQQTSLPVINACSTCRGACCLQGKGHAFLVKEFLAWRLLNENGMSPTLMIEDYLSRIPKLSYDKSCVYQGPEGCVLTREVRSSTCNGFLCTGIHDGFRRVQDRNTVSSIAIVDSDGEQRVGIWNADEDRTETELQFHDPL